MEFINRVKLRGLMAEKEISNSDLSHLLNITASAMRNKMRGNNQFTESEIVVLKKHFGDEIFLK